MFIVYDLDGTLANIEHRAHYVRDGNRQWDKFFEECDKDLPEKEVIATLVTLFEDGHRVEIWSGRSDVVRGKTEAWLDANIPMLFNNIGELVKPSTLLTHMRPAKDFQSDVELKRSWLHASDVKPDLIFDDRQGVVDMWREEGIKVAQVAPGDFDKPKAPIRPRTPSLILMVGPSGAGKSTFLYQTGIHESYIVSSDIIRRQLFPDHTGNAFCSPEAYTPEGFKATFAAVHAVAKARLDSGLDVFIDSTNIKRKDRLSLLEALGVIDGSVDVIYIIFDRPLEEKLESYTNHGGKHTNPEIIEKHHKTFQSSVKDALKGDGLPFVTVVDERQ